MRRSLSFHGSKPTAEVDLEPRNPSGSFRGSKPTAIVDFEPRNLPGRDARPLFS
jgi:hypothetical protein